jgi:hypothetical protein
MSISFFAIIFLGLGIMLVVMNLKNQKRAGASSTWPSTQGRILQEEVHEGESVLMNSVNQNQFIILKFDMNMK